MADWIEGDWIFDIETYPNCFTFCLIRGDGKHQRIYEVSEFRNDTEELLTCLRYLKANKQRLVGFNNLGFDYPVIHKIIEKAIIAKFNDRGFTIDYEDVYEDAMSIINEMRNDGWGRIIPTEEQHIKQVDLYKIWHFDNKAKSTSLKMLEFNMKADNIEDLPFPVGTHLTQEQIEVLKRYNKHDVIMTLEFYRKSVDAIRFRQVLSERYNRDFTNHNDTKIGKDYFIMRLEETMPNSCYKMQGKKRVLNQTKRAFIDIGKCLFDYYDFEQPAFVAVKEWFAAQKIKETKGVFSDIEEHQLGDVAKYAELTTKRIRFKNKPSEQEWKDFIRFHPLAWMEEVELKAMVDLLDEQGNPVFETVLNAKGKPQQKKVKVPKKSYWGCYKVAETLNVVINGFRFDFGTGGIHGSVESSIVRAKGTRKVKDADVSSMYPNIAISNNVYPAHLSERFCDIYKDVYNQRKGFAKGTPENGVMKLALNGVYGDSNNEYSPFYDPAYTMTITVNGQLSLCLLAERLMKIPELNLIQVNTDGVTVEYDEKYEDLYNSICEKWQRDVKLELEFADYSAMFIRDVNNYIALYTNGKVKRKGAYEYEGLGWHQNHSCLVVPMAAEAAMVKGEDFETYIRNHDNKYDFMLRTKVPRSSRLVMVYEDGYSVQLQNICRYYPSTMGGKLVKIMPPLEGETEERNLGIDVDWNVKVCNDISQFEWSSLNYDYYIQEAKKLIISE